jgi:phosphoribosylanthranilate isomerase
MKIKICGLFREEDIEAANEAKPDYIGFVFAKSRRQINAIQAAKLRKKLGGGIIPVGVFVDAEHDEITALYRDRIIAAAQLHGSEDADYIAKLREQCDVPVIKAMHIGEKMYDADFFLVDNGPGGTGESFDWSILSSAIKNSTDGINSNTFSEKFFLAGGIGLHNLEQAMSFKPYAIDVSSGAETAGVKDREKMIALVQRIRAGII